MEEPILDLDVNSIYGWCYREKKEMILKFSSSFDDCKNVIFYIRELNQKSDELLECLNKIHNFCRVCRIFTTNYELGIDTINCIIHSKMRLEIHSGSMINEETLEREIRNMICFTPFTKHYMTWSLENVKM